MQERSSYCTYRSVDCNKSQVREDNRPEQELVGSMSGNSYLDSVASHSTGERSLPQPGLLYSCNYCNCRSYSCCNCFHNNQL